MRSSGEFRADYVTGREPYAPDDGDARELVRLLLLEVLTAQRAGRRPDPPVRLQARALCRCARDAGLSIERVLVALKDEWQGTPEARRLPRGEAAELLSRIVTVCIDEYYADVRPQ